ncbi:hypothetical protein [Limosilactobacillus agrestis]|uniref:hypothetical protein n=1 Tax=Limosilactobacillus agrestis TaxID=2759748 RepID=UPI001E2F17F6|nr:hypothetical protein [Limosilactobacillus agrestis]MCD7112057.1 hypothetical protein [Limosilactobacillus agrestis]
MLAELDYHLDVAMVYNGNSEDFYNVLIEKQLLNISIGKVTDEPLKYYQAIQTVAISGLMLLQEED